MQAYLLILQRSKFDSKTIEIIEKKKNGMQLMQQKLVLMK